MTDGGPQNGKQVKPEDKCNWCNQPVGVKGAKTSIPGFPYCPDDQNGGWKKSLNK